MQTWFLQAFLSNEDGSPGGFGTLTLCESSDACGHFAGTCKRGLCQRPSNEDGSRVVSTYDIGEHQMPVVTLQEIILHSCLTVHNATSFTRNGRLTNQQAN
ncbi:hypothetical protein AHF37_01682 [Paragonimus kellicotti]|nr:hypothetical protein AHF37_01682 [Paragonimus kellicotti]